MSIIVKACVKCNKILPADLDNFYAHGHTLDRLQSRCKVCNNLSSRISQGISAQKPGEQIHTFHDFELKEFGYATT